MLSRPGFLTTLSLSHGPLLLPQQWLASKWLIRTGPLRSAVPDSQRAFKTWPSANASIQAQKRRHRDPYALAQARARRAANISRQEVLDAERLDALGDPVRGVSTPFVQSLDAAALQATGLESHTESKYLNHFLSTSELTKSVQQSNLLSAPPTSSEAVRGSTDPARQEYRAQQHEKEHAAAEVALSRITALENGSSKDRTRVNIQRCIETFGRHNTDNHLVAKPRSTIAYDLAQPRNEKTPRAGPDTGSSEVQIAILTAKIRTLADFLDSRGRKDKVNKRNLRLMVHKRQKLLRYLRSKERGGERWQHCIKTLGLTEGTWNGEISL